jgi:AcrR family transcriptional regulator
MRSPASRPASRIGVPRLPIRAPRPPPAATTRERIIDAAYRVFKFYEINKATIDDIAKEAKLSRATIYKHFDSKEALLRHISEINLQRIHLRIMESVGHAQGFAAKLTEALCVATKIARKDNYTRRIFDSIETASWSVNPRHSNFEITRESWRPFLERARATGELCADLDLDEVVIWITLSLIAMYVRLATLKLNNAQIRNYFARYVVRPLLADSAPR